VETQKIQSYVEDRIGWIALNNKRRKNALHNTMYEAILELLDTYEKDEQIRTIVIKGNDGNFSTGYDLTQGLPDPYRDFVKDLSSATAKRLWYCKKPTISMVEGYCLGGGFELAMGADLVYAAEDAAMGEPEIDFFFTPDYNSIPCLSLARKAKEMILLGSVINGKEAADIGLVNKAFPKEKLASEVIKTCKRIASLPAETVEVAKVGLNGALDVQGFKTAIEYGEEIAIYNGLLSKTNPNCELFYRAAKEKGLKEAIKLVRDYTQGGQTGERGWKKK
jgi:enoyl-CoA hydratase/carnithine racemase